MQKSSARSWIFTFLEWKKSSRPSRIRNERRGRTGAYHAVDEFSAKLSMPFVIITTFAVNLDLALVTLPEFFAVPLVDRVTRAVLANHRFRFRACTADLRLRRCERRTTWHMSCIFSNHVKIISRSVTNPVMNFSREFLAYKIKRKVSSEAEMVYLSDTIFLLTVYAAILEQNLLPFMLPTELSRMLASHSPRSIVSQNISMINKSWTRRFYYFKSHRLLYAFHKSIFISPH